MFVTAPVLDPYRAPEKQERLRKIDEAENARHGVTERRRGWVVLISLFAAALTGNATGAQPIGYLVCYVAFIAVGVLAVFVKDGREAKERAGEVAALVNSEKIFFHERVGGMLTLLAEELERLPWEMRLELRPVWDEAVECGRILENDASESEFTEALRRINERTDEVYELRMEHDEFLAAAENDRKAVEASTREPLIFSDGQDVELIRQRKEALIVGRRRFETLTEEIS